MQRRFGEISGSFCGSLILHSSVSILCFLVPGWMNGESKINSHWDCWVIESLKKAQERRPEVKSLSADLLPNDEPQPVFCWNTAAKRGGMFLFISSGSFSSSQVSASSPSCLFQKSRHVRCEDVQTAPAESGSGRVRIHLLHESRLFYRRKEEGKEKRET